jgi:hypothetical protein
VNCKTCNEPLVSMGEDIWQTCVGYQSPEGHDHDDNCMSRSALCSAGHSTTIALRRNCPACDWRGKAECRTCGGGIKLDAWPDLPIRSQGGTP